MAKWKRAVPDAAQQRELKLDALYREAAQAFRRDGYHATSLNDIAKALGISKPTLYYYVKNKQDLLYQCHLAAAEQALQSVCAEPGLKPIERLHRTTAAYVRSTISDDSYSVIILEEKSLSAAQLDIVVRERDKFEGALLGMIEAAMQDGSILPGNAKFAVLIVLGAINWVTKWYRPHRTWSIEEIAEGVAGFVCRGLASGEAPAFLGSRLLENRQN